MTHCTNVGLVRFLHVFEKKFLMPTKAAFDKKNSNIMKKYNYNFTTSLFVYILKGNLFL